MQNKILLALCIAAIIGLSGCTEFVDCANNENEISGFFGCVRSSLRGTGDNNCIVGSGNIVTETRDVTEFNAIMLNGFGNIILTQEETSLSLEGEDNVVAATETRVENNMLIIENGDSPFRQCVRTTKPLNIIVSTPNINAITTNGSGTIDFNAETEKLTTTINGSGKGLFNGKATEHTLNLNGSGNFSALEMQTEKCTVNISGSGNADVFASQELTISISGSGAVRYKGTPKLTQTIFGTGKIESIE